MGAMLNDTVLQVVQALGRIAREVGLSTAQMCLAWVLRKSEVSAALVGATRPEQLDENVAASGVRLDALVLGRIDEAVASSVQETRGGDQ
jgi:aryl-alcohol dehydrogenase-like predicted oxidoreductase